MTERPVAVITGASRGIGRAVADALSDEYTIASICRSPAKRGHWFSCDVSVPHMIQRAMTEIRASLGPPSVLVTCAGVALPPGPARETTPDAWRRVMAVNLSGTFFAAQAFAEVAARPAVLVTVASTAGLRPQPGWAGYAASKAGVVNLSLTLAEEWGPEGIRVHCIAPGRCATGLRRQLAPDEDPATIMQPGEVAALVATLIRDGSLLAGQVVTVKRATSDTPVETSASEAAA